MKVVFIGGGNMAMALVSGLLEKGTKPGDLSVVDISLEARQKFEAMGLSVSSTFSDVNINPDVVILAVKPQHLKEAIHSYASSLKNSLIISIVAGIPVASIANWLDDHERIVRVMPNTPALIRAGVSGMYNGSKTIGDRELAETVVSCVGQYVWCETESLIDAVTAVSGSGPAYVFYFIEALEAAALELGLAPDAARLLSVETFLGASRLAARSEEAPFVLRDRVTSKGGTTAAALASFEVDQMKEMIVKGVRRANSRSTELARDYGGKKA
jgi:pyrroline-5-carboxylate reductase